MEQEQKEADKWTKLRPQIRKDAIYNKYWQEEIGLFKERFEVKYFTPIENLIKQDFEKAKGSRLLRCSVR